MKITPLPKRFAIGKWGEPWKSWAKGWLQDNSCRFVRDHKNGNLIFDVEIKSESASFLYDFITLGGYMSGMKSAIVETTDAMTEALDTARKTSNELVSIAAVIDPMLTSMVNQIRDHRMTVVNELHQALQAMRDVRKFFLEEGYEKEMKRLEEFTKACQLLREMKQDGTLDAIADVAIRLAIKQEGEV